MTDLDHPADHRRCCRGGKTIALEFGDGSPQDRRCFLLLNGPVFALIASDDEAFAASSMTPSSGPVLLGPT